MNFVHSSMRTPATGRCTQPPSEFVRDLLRQKKEELEAARIRDSILEGYEDVLKGRAVEYRGDLQSLLSQTSR